MACDCLGSCQRTKKEQIETMKRVSQLLLSLLVGWSMLVAAAPQVVAAEKIHSSRRLPSKVYGYLSIRNVAQFKEKFGKSLTGQLLAEPELEDVKEQIGEVMKDRATEVEANTGLTLRELLQLPQGEVSIALVQPRGGKLSMVLMLDFGSERESVDKLIAKAMERLEEEDAERSTEEFEDNEISIVTKPTELDTAIEKTIAYCIKDTVLVMANQPAGVKAVLSRWDGEHDSTLSNNDVFEYLTKKCGGPNEDSAPLATWFLDPIGMIQAILAANPQTPPQAMMVLGVLPVVGLDKLKAVGGTVDMGVEDFDSVSRTLVYLEPPTTGLLNAFQFPPESQSPPGWVPAEASSFFSINWAVKDAFGAIQTLVDTFQGPGALSMMLDSLSDEQFNGDLHLKDDFLDLLTGVIRVMSDTPQGEGPQAARTLTALELNDSAAGQATLAKITGLQGFPGKSREFRGHTIYEIPAQGLFQGLVPGANANALGDQEERLAGFAVVNDHLMFTTDVKQLEQVIRRDPDAKKLADTPEYKRIAAHFPDKTSSVGFQRENADMKALYEALKSGNAEFLLGRVLSDIDFSRLPEFEVISKYLRPSGSFMIPDERGLLMQSFTLRNKE